MDLLDSILRTAKAERYLENFRDADIKPHNLKILVEKDLELIGVDDPVVRKNLLQNTRNLAIQSENRVETLVDNNYAEIVLMHISNQVIQHHANLICAAKRPDIINCDVQLEEATDSLLKVIRDFKVDLLSLKQKLQPEKVSKKEKVRKTIIWTSFFGILVCCTLIITQKLSK